MYCRARQATEDNMAHAQCMLDTLRLQTHTLRFCNAHYFFHYNNGCTNAPQCYVTRILSVMLQCCLRVLTICVRFRYYVPAYIYLYRI
jgi:hypothetical protein